MNFQAFTNAYNNEYLKFENVTEIFVTGWLYVWHIRIKDLVMCSNFFFSSLIVSEHDLDSCIYPTFLNSNWICQIEIEDCSLTLYSL